MEGIIDFVTGAFRGKTLDRLSAQLNETPTAIEHGIAQAVPLSLAGVAERAQTDQGANELFDHIRDGSYPHMDAGQLAQTAADPVATQEMVQSNTGFLNGLLGNKLSRLVDGVRGTSGLSHSSASTLLGLVSPMVLGWIGNKVTTQGLNAQGLSRLLATEGQKISGKLPAGFSSMFAGTKVAESRFASGEVDEIRAQRTHRPAERTHSKGPWLFAALAGLAAILLFWSFGRYKQPRLHEVQAPVVVTREVERTVVLEPTQAEPARPEPARMGSEATELQPVAGTDVGVLRNDAEPLKAFFESADPAPRRFVLDGIHFDSDGANVSSNAMLDQLAKVIAAHPSARASIEGHTDNTGTQATNQQLSQRRADAVRTYLIRQAIPANQLTAVGRSASKPIGDNATPEGRAENRRVELVVTQR